MFIIIFNSKLKVLKIKKNKKIIIYLLDFDELAVEERFSFANLHNGYGLVMMINHAQRRWFQLVSSVSFGWAVHTVCPADDASQQDANQPQVRHRHFGGLFIYCFLYL